MDAYIRNDVIWIMEGDRIVEKRSMHCPKLDDGRVDEGDPDLEVEFPLSETLLKPQSGRMFASWRGLLWRDVAYLRLR